MSMDQMKTIGWGLKPGPQCVTLPELYFHSILPLLRFDFWQDTWKNTNKPGQITQTKLCLHSLKCISL